VPSTPTPPGIWYARRGTGEPLLLITGFAISSAVFEPILPLYESHFDCVMYDNRGAGRSRPGPWLTSIPQLAGDAVRLLDALGVDSAHVYGASMGGMIAQELALRFPERVRGLVLAGTTPGGPRAIRPALGELSVLLAETAGTLRDPGRPWLAALLFSKQYRAEQPARVRELLAYFARHRASPRGLTAHFWASVYHDTVSRLHRIQAPTLVMHGEHDVLSPLANARLLAESIPQAELAVMPGAGHACALERPEEALALFLDWLRARGYPVTAGSRNTGFAARTEPVTRTLGLPVGVLRTGASLMRLGYGRLGRPRMASARTRGVDDVAADGPSMVRSDEPTPGQFHR
jgi:pimeloyl-ACP methyl ester carboxylesterase